MTRDNTSEGYGTETSHKLTREGKATFYEVYDLDDDGGLEATHDEERGPCEMYQTYECSCGRRFRKQELAAEHLRSVREDPDDGE